MIHLKNAMFDFCVSSGALAFDGRGWPWEFPLRWAGVIDPKAFIVVAKTVTVKPKTGNLSLLHPWTCVRTLPGLGTTNAVGLTNPGVHHWLTHDYPRARRMGYNIAMSVKPESPDEAHEIAPTLRQCNLSFIEINMSCPNVPGQANDEMQDMLNAFYQKSGHSIILKLSLDQVNEEFIKRVDEFVDGYHAINTVPWDRIYPEAQSPIQKYKHGLKGGVSGPAIRTLAIGAVDTLRSFTTKPIIGGGGIFSVQDVHDFKSAGASAFSIGSCFLHRPWRPNRIVREWRNSDGHLPGD